MGSFAELAARSLPSVVTVKATGSGGRGATGSGFVYDDSGRGALHHAGRR